MAVGQVLKRVLVVEDEFLIARDIEKMLSDLGIEVVGPASSLQSALYLARNEDLDGAILDVNLGDGIFVTLVADELSERGVPFALATSYRLWGTDVPPAGCVKLAKPFSVEQLRDVIGIMFH
jgi:DNA-binding response OmpR family regulator